MIRAKVANKRYLIITTVVLTLPTTLNTPRAIGLSVRIRSRLIFLLILDYSSHLYFTLKFRHFCTS